jgi:biotin synthase
MTPREVLDSVKEAAELGFKALVLQSGEDDYYTTGIFENIVKRIRKDFPALIFLSAGERGRDFYKRMFEAGARGVLFRFETSNKSLYEKMKPDNKFEDRIAHLNFFKEQGYLIASGGLLGLPGQTKEDMVNDILLAKSFGAEMYSFGPFIPHPDTPLRDSKVISKGEMLKFIAIARLMVPDAKILVTTALETVDAGMRRSGLLSGANSFMLNVTPLKYRRQYEIYKNRANCDKPAREQVEEALALLKELGRAPTDLGL